MNLIKLPCDKNDNKKYQMILIKNLIIFLCQKRKKFKLIVVLKSKSPGHSVKYDSLNQSLFNQTNSL